jgi:hypothetical protein
MATADTPHLELEERLAAIFVSRIRKIDGPLADIVQGHLDSGMRLSTVEAMLKDSMRVVEAARGQAS